MSSLELRNVSLRLRNVSLELRNVSLELRNVSFSGKRPRTAVHVPAGVRPWAQREARPVLQREELCQAVAGGGHAARVAQWRAPPRRGLVQRASAPLQHAAGRQQRRERQPLCCGCRAIDSMLGEQQDEQQQQHTHGCGRQCGAAASRRAQAGSCLAK